MVDFCPGNTWEKQKGQVLLIVVLVMIVALTVGLSLISRSITNLRTSTEEAESQKALSAAEAGVEQALKSGEGIPTGSFSSGDATIEYRTTVEEVKGTEFLINGGNAVPRDDGADLWLSLYSAVESEIFTSPRSGTITLFWGESQNTCTATAPALEISVITGSKDSPSLQRYTADPCPTRVLNNHFTAALNSGESVEGVTFNWKTNISVTNGLIMRIIPVYNDARIGVTFAPSGGSPIELPLQGKLITSTGESGKTQRKINVFQGYPKIPAELFPYAIFSPQ